jgi:hypothetical protein
VPALPADAGRRQPNRPGADLINFLAKKNFGYF